MRKRIITLGLCLGLALAAGGAAGNQVKVIALFTGKAMLQVGGKQKVVSVGETFEGVLLKKADGRGAVVMVDGETLELGLISRNIAGGYQKPTRDRATVYPDASGMYYLSGSINGRATRFLIDTGATDIAISARFARELKIDFENEGEADFAETASERVPIYKIRLDTVTAGGITVRNVDTIVIPGNMPEDVLLGNSFLRHTQMIKAGSVLEIRKRW